MKMARAGSIISLPNAAIAEGRTRKFHGRRLKPVRRSPGNIRPVFCVEMEARASFYSIAVSNGAQQVDSGTKMLHLGKNTKSRIISKGISAGRSQNTYRGQVSAHRKATDARNFTQCDSLLIGDQCGAHTVPYIEAKNSTAQFEHEATTSKDFRRSAFLLPAKGNSRGRGDCTDRQRFRQGSDSGTSDGICCRGPKADRDQPRREAWGNDGPGSETRVIPSSHDGSRTNERYSP